MARPDAPLSRFVTPLAVVVVVVALSLARELLIPIALSVLFSFLLSPLVNRLERWRIARVPAVLLVTGLAAALIGVVGYMVVRQGIDLTASLPRYRDNIEARLRALTPGRDNPLSKAAETLEDISEEIADDQEKGEAQTQPGETRRPGQPQEGEPAPEEKPVPVAVVPPRQSPITVVAQSAGPLLGPLTTAGMVLVLVLFVLLRREDLRDRLIHLGGRGDLQMTTQALTDASARVSRYLLMQLVVNTIYAVPVGIGLVLIGVPNALLFALLGLLLRFIPYVGPVVAAGMPILLSLAVFDDWTHPLFVVGLYVTIELIVNNLVEPWLYGSSTGMSSVAVIVSAMFWTWLWGPVGLLMATPMTATLVAFGKHVPQLSFLDVLLGDEPVGTAETRFYQRLLATDQDEAADIAEEELEQRGSLVEVYDEVILPALHMAERDRHAGRLDEERSELVRDGVAAIAEVLLEAQPRIEPRATDEGRTTVLCIPARDAADELVGKLLTGLVEVHGHPARNAPVDALLSERLETIERVQPRMVCISALPPSTTAHVRYICKRLRPRFPDLPIVIGLWHSGLEAKQARVRIGCDSGDPIVTTLAEAIDEIRRVISRHAIVPARDIASS